MATIAVGIKAKKFMHTQLRSLMRNANFKAPLYIITDDIPYFTRLLRTSEFRPLAAIVRPTKLEESPKYRAGEAANEPLVLDDMKHARRGRRGGERLEMRIKSMKCRLFHFVSVAYDYVLFVDADILFGRELAPMLREMLKFYIAEEEEEVEEEEEGVSGAVPFAGRGEARGGARRGGGGGGGGGGASLPAPLVIFPDIGTTESLYHGGVLFLSRAHSRRLLERWEYEIHLGGHGRDQPALNATITALGVADRVGIMSLAAHWYTFLNGTAIATAQPYTLIHAATHRLTHPAKFNFTHEQAVRYYQDVLHLNYDYDFVITPLFTGWATFEDFEHVAENIWLTPRGHEAFESRYQRRQRLEQQGLQLDGPLLAEEDERVERKQKRDLQRFINLVRALSYKFKWKCVDERGLNAFVVHFLKLHAQRRAKFIGDDNKDKEPAYKELYQKELVNCELD